MRAAAIPPRTDLRGVLAPQIESRLPGAVTAAESRGELYLSVPPERLLELCRLLRDEPSWRFDFLALVSGVDWLERSPRFDVVYQLRSLRHNSRVALKVPVPDGTVTVPSVAGIWVAADWMEREVFDLFGIRFEGHPNLKRIMMPDDWEGHPYRRDYPLEGRG